MRRAAEFPVVALVSSTGGLDALSRVLTRLSAGFPAAVVALQHLDPEQHSHLPELLAHKTILPVCWAVDGQSVVPGTVVVAPPGRHMLVGGNGEVALVLSGKTPPPRPSADLLLSSLAGGRSGQALRRPRARPRSSLGGSVRNAGIGDRHPLGRSRRPH